MISIETTCKGIIILMLAHFFMVHSEAAAVMNMDFDTASDLGGLSVSRESKAWTPDGKEVAPKSLCLTKGISGQGIYAAGAASNQLTQAASRGDVSSPGLQAVGAAEIRATDTAWEGDEAIHVKTAKALNSGVTLTGLQVGGGKGVELPWYVASAYVRGRGKIVFFAEDESRGIVFPPLEVTLTPKWHRIVILFPVAESTDTLALKWLTTGGDSADFSLDGLQLEASEAGRYGWASQWLPGGEKREADIINLPLPENFSLEEGSISLWFQPDWSMVPQFHGNYGWQQPARSFLYLDDRFRLMYQGQPQFVFGTDERGRAAVCGVNWEKAGEFDWAARSWHLWSVTWKSGVLRTYLDGQLYDEIKGVNPPPQVPEKIYIGSSPDSSLRPADAVLDNVQIFNKALSPTAIQRQYSEGRAVLAKENRDLSDCSDAFMEIRSLDGNEVMFDPCRFMSFDPAPTKSVNERLKAWKKRGLDVDSPLVALFPDDGENMLSPIHGRLIQPVLETGAEYRLKIGRIGFPAKSNAGRFPGLSAWSFSEETKDGIVGGTIFTEPHAEHSLAAWIFIRDRFCNGPIFAEGGSVNGFNISVSRGQLVADVSSESETVLVRKELGEEHENKWLFVACVYNGNADKPELSMFIDGKQVDTAPVNFKVAQPGTLPWRVGRFRQTVFEGLIDEVLIWEKALSASELTQWYEKGRPSTSEPKNLSADKTDSSHISKATDPMPDGNGIPGNAVYLYASFDGTVQPDLAASPLLRGWYATTSSTRGEIDDRSEETLTEPGKFGHGVTLFQRKDKNEGDVLRYPTRNEDWDAGEGAISFWFKPDWNSSENTSAHWLWDNLWVDFMSMVQSQRISAFAGKTADYAQAPAYGYIDDRIKAGIWHHYAAVWGKGGQLQVYLDGEIVAENKIPAQLRKWGRPYLYVGCSQMAAEAYGQKRADGTPRLDAVIDELLLTRQSLTSNQVAALAAGDVPAAKLIRPMMAFSSLRTAFRRDEKIRIPVACFNGDTITFELHDDNGQMVKRQQMPATETTVFELAPYALSPGRYQLDAYFTVNGHQVEQLERELVVNSDEISDIIVGSYGPWSSPDTPGFEAAMREAGTQFMVIGSAGSPEFAKVVDRYYRCGVAAVPAMHVYNTRAMKVKGIPKEHYAQVDPDGTWYDYASPFAEVTMDAARTAIDETISNGLNNPAMRYLSMWDETGMRADVSSHAKSNFQKRTGLPVPEFKAVEPGTIVDDKAPLARWVEMYGCGWWMSSGLAYADRKLTDYVHEQYPGRKTMAMPSSGFGGSDIEVVEVYPYLIESPIARLSGKSEMMTEALVESYFASMPDRENDPLCVLPGWLNHPSDPHARQSLNVMNQVAMAKGAQGFIPAPMSWFWERPDMRKDYIAFSRFCRRYGAMLTALQRNGTAPLAVLWNPHDIMTTKNGWRRGWHLSTALLPHLRAAGIAYEIVRLDDLRAGKLKNYDGLLALDTKVLTQDVLDSIESFTADGGHVWVSSDSPIKPKGSLVLPVNSHWITQPYEIRRIIPGNLPIENVVAFAPELRAAIAPHLRTPFASVDTPYVAVYEAYYGDTRYLFLVNSDIYQNRFARIRLRDKANFVYELTKGRVVSPVPDGDGAIFGEEIESGGWRIYAIPPRSIADCTASLSVDKDGHAKYSVALKDADGKSIEGAWPLMLTLIDREGKERHHRSVAMTSKRIDGEFILSSLTEPKDGWTLRIEDLFSGNKWVIKGSVKSFMKNTPPTTPSFAFNKANNSVVTSP